MIPVSDSIYIFGAHTRAQNLYAYLRVLFPECKVLGFLYDNDESNPQSLWGIDVMPFHKLKELPEKSAIWLAVKSIYFEEIARKIRAECSNPVILVSSQVDNELRNRYAEKVLKEKGIPYAKIYDLLKKDDEKQKKEPVIYMAKSIYDQQTKEYTCPSYIVPIQAGAALTDKKIAAVSDHTGENISDKNQQYCELTVLYWIWKNICEPWVGLCHYRRHFVLSKEEAALIPEAGVDAIFPVPSICQPSVGQNYRKRHDKNDWEYLLNLLKYSYPDFYDLALELWETQKYGTLYYTCNMFIMKKEVLNRYCSWLFPILEEVERFGGKKPDSYQNRYLGFMAERLMTLYFMYYRDTYQIAYADKIFIPK